MWIPVDRFLLEHAELRLAGTPFDIETAVDAEIFNGTVNRERLIARRNAAKPPARRHPDPCDNPPVTTTNRNALAILAAVAVILIAGGVLFDRHETRADAECMNGPWTTFSVGDLTAPEPNPGSYTASTAATEWGAEER